MPVDVASYRYSPLEMQGQYVWQSLYAQPLCGFLFAAAKLTVILVLSRQSLTAAEHSATNQEQSDHTFISFLLFSLLASLSLSLFPTLFVPELLLAYHGIWLQFLVHMQAMIWSCVKERVTILDSGAESSHFREWVREVFWLMSTDKSRKSSSLLRTVSHERHFVSLTSTPWKMSCTHVGLERSSSSGR